VVEIEIARTVPGYPRILALPLGRSPKYHLIDSGEGVRIQDELRRGIGFLGFDMDNAEMYKASCFAIYVKSGRIRNSYLVTAKHNLINLAGKQCFVRMTTKGREPIRVELGNRRWYYHPTEEGATDVAVLPFREIAEWGSWPEINDTVTDEDIATGRVGCGDEGFIVGLFSALPGETKNIPIYRSCHIAAMELSDPVRMRAKDVQEPMECYLVEARSIGGLSGSPVFTVSNPQTGTDYEPDPAIKHPQGFQARQYMPRDSGNWLLLGLVHGHWDVSRGQLSKMMGVEDDEVNSGIAVVVPAKKIAETLNHPELVAMRAEIEDRFSKSTQSTPD
jgi:hypothetical protein